MNPTRISEVISRSTSCPTCVWGTSRSWAGRRSSRCAGCAAADPGGRLPASNRDRS